MKKATMWCALAAATMVTGSGCRTTAGIRVESYPITKIVVNSKALASYLQVAKVDKVERSGLWEAQITVESRKRKDFYVMYMFRWLREDGIQVTSGLSSWAPVKIRARDMEMIKAMAPSPEAQHFICDIKFLDSSRSP